MLFCFEKTTIHSGWGDYMITICDAKNSNLSVRDVKELRKEKRIPNQVICSWMESTKTGHNPFIEFWIIPKLVAGIRMQPLIFLVSSCFVYLGASDLYTKGKISLFLWLTVVVSVVWIYIIYRKGCHLLEQPLCRFVKDLNGLLRYMDINDLQGVSSKIGSDFSEKFKDYYLGQIQRIYQCSTVTSIDEVVVELLPLLEARDKFRLFGFFTPEMEKECLKTVQDLLRKQDAKADAGGAIGGCHRSTS